MREGLKGSTAFGNQKFVGDSGLRNIRGGGEMKAVKKRKRGASSFPGAWLGSEAGRKVDVLGTRKSATSSPASPPPRAPGGSLVGDA